MKKQLSALLSAALCVTSAGVSPSASAEYTGAEITYNYGGESHIRTMERLDRGLVAVDTGDGVFLSWRLNGDEAKVSDLLSAPDFEIYKNGERLAAVADSTNFLDKDGSASDSYAVAIEGGEPCAAITPLENAWFDVQLRAPEPEDVVSEIDSNGNVSYDRLPFSPSDVSCGDLDGDGEYELVVKWVNKEVDVGNGGYAGTVHLDAYKLDGTPLWERSIAMGRNVYSSAHTLQFLVYDFDGDGKAEVICQTSLGSADGAGEYVSKASADPDIKGITDAENADTDYRSTGNNERITEGREFLTVFEGETGKAVDTIDLPTERVSCQTFGDDTGNRCNRFVSTVAWLDGENPYAVFLRGYYFGKNGQQRTSVCGVSYKDNRLVCGYNFDTLSTQPGYVSGNEKYVGQGNHNITVADVDGDGRDEVITGALCLEADETSDLKVKWCTFKEHGDALHIGDYDPTHPGLEFFTVHEDGGGVNVYGGVTLDYGASVIDAETGEIIKHWSASKDTGRGLMANVGAGGYYQIAAGAGVGGWYCMGGSAFESGVSIGTNFRVFWDGDLYDETLDGTVISDWDGSRMSAVFNAEGCVSVNGTKANPSLQADILGDWREEVIYPTADGSALRVFTTTELTEHKLPTLMHDPVYRSGVAAEQTAYNQPPHIGFYLADEIYRPSVESIEIAETPYKTAYFVGEELDITGLEVTAHFADGSSDAVTGYVVMGYDADSAAVQTVTVTYAGKTAEFEVIVDSGFEIDESGYITGCSLGREEAVLPLSINGETVRGIASNALKNSGIKTLKIAADELDIAEGALPDGIRLICVLGSDAHIYAIERGIDCEALDTRDYTVNVGYDESGYAGLELLQNTAAQSASVGHVTYSVGGRRQGGDGKTGFSIAEYDGNAVLKAGVGQFSSNGRNALMTVNDLPMISDTVDSVFETDIIFNDLKTMGRSEETVLKAAAVVLDSNGNQIDYVSTSALGLESGSRYNYKLICHKGVYTRIIRDIDGNVISSETLDAAASGSGAAMIMFLQESGDYGQGRNTYILLDDTKAYTNIEISDLTLRVVDENEDPIALPTVVLNGVERHGGRTGVYSESVTADVYGITVSAEGYETSELTVGAFKNEVERTVVLKRLYVPLEGLRFEKPSLALKVGGSGRLCAVPVPADASEAEVKYISSDESVAAVGSDGTVTAVGAGDAVITAMSASDPEKIAECSVTVYADYESELKAIEIEGEGTALIPNNPVSNRVKFTARGYDQNGVEIAVPAVWSADGGLSVDGDGTLSVPRGVAAGIYTVTAASGTVTGSAQIELSRYVGGSNIIAEDRFEETLSLFMGDEPVSETVGDITYAVGSRAGGDGSTGFVVSSSARDLIDGRMCMQVRTGRFSNSNREPYMIFDKVSDTSVYSPSADYVFETDLYFAGAAKMQFTDFSGNPILRVEPDLIGISKNTWYHYMLIYSGGRYSCYITDMDGNMAAKPELTLLGSGMAAQLHFLPETGSGEMVCLTDMIYYSTDSAFSDIGITVQDENGAPIEGITVEAAGLSAQTNSLGTARFTLPLGIYNAAVSDAALEGGAIAVADGTVKKVLITVSDKPQTRIVSVNGAEVTVYAGESGLKLYAAKYSDGVLERIAAFDAENGEKTYDAGFEPNKIFLWDGEMKPIDNLKKQ